MMVVHELKAIVIVIVFLMILPTRMTKNEIGTV